MSIFTRDKIWFSADKQTYWEHDRGARDAALFVEGKEVLTASTSGLVVNGTIASSGGLDVDGRLSVLAGMSWSVSTGLAHNSTLGLDTVVSVFDATTANTLVTLTAPSSAGIVKIISNIAASTLHIDFTTGVLISGFATAGNLNILPNGCVGLISLTTVAYKIMFPTTVNTVLFTTLAT